MAYEGGKGRGKSGGFGGKKPYAKREGGYGEKRPYAKREGGFERKPREGGFDGEKRPYRARSEGGEGGEKRPYTPRSGGSYGEKRPYVKREGGYGDKKPYAKREGGYDRKPREGGFDGEKRPYRARTEGFEGRERSFEKRPYQKREGGFGDKPYAKREGGYDRKPRGDFGEKRSFMKREGGERYSGPRERFEGDAPHVRGEGKTARFDGKRAVKHEREVLVSGDGWLVGYHAVVAALKIGRRSVRKIWLLGEAQGELATLLAAHPEWEVEIKAKPDFEKEFGDAVHQGVAALVGNLPQPSLPELLADKPKLLVALDQVTDPHNLGAIVRSCAAFGAGGVIVTEHRAAGLSATAAKAAAGALETVPVTEVVNLVQSIKMLQEAGFTVIGLAGEATVEIGEIAETGPVCLIVGSEGDGLRRLTREHCDRLVKIAISDSVESLNVSVATGVALAILSRK